MASFYRREVRWHRNRADLSAAAESRFATLSPGLASLPSPLATCVRDELEALVEPHVTLLWLRFAREWTWREIGDHLELSPSAAKRRYQRLQRQVMLRCGHHLGEPDSEPTKTQSGERV